MFMHFFFLVRFFPLRPLILENFMGSSRAATSPLQYGTVGISLRPSVRELRPRERGQLPPRRACASRWPFRSGFLGENGNLKGIFDAERFPSPSKSSARDPRFPLGRTRPP